MIPALSGENGDFDALETVEQPTLTYKLDTDRAKVIGTAEGLEAVKQAVYKILQTERYEYPVYSGDYGVELKDLYGQPVSYICPELERRITEALLWDSRIREVSDFSFDTSVKGAVTAAFTITTVFGKINAEKEVRV